MTEAIQQGLTKLKREKDSIESELRSKQVHLRNVNDRFLKLERELKISSQKGTEEERELDRLKAEFERISNNYKDKIAAKEREIQKSADSGVKGNSDLDSAKRELEEAEREVADLRSKSIEKDRQIAQMQLELQRKK